MFPPVTPLARRIARRIARLDGLRARMALLTGLVLAAPAAYAVIHAVLAYERQGERALAGARDRARGVAGGLAGRLEALRLEAERAALAAAAPSPGADGPAPDPRGCGAALLGRADPALGVARLSVSGAGAAPGAGTPAVPAGGPVRPICAAERAAGPGPGIALSLPLDLGPGPRGALDLELAAGPRAAWPAQPPGPPHEGAVMLLVADGGDLGRARAAAEAAAAAAGVRATARLFAAETVVPGQLAAAVGVPAARGGWLERDLVNGILAPLLMVALAVLAIWIATDLLINRHVRTLAAFARSLGQGDAAAATAAWPGGIAGAPPELRELGRTLLALAERLGGREAELEASLEEKNALLREVHHRIKNNLQIVTSLLNLRARSLADAPARRALEEAQMRIKALALVHRRLYERSELRDIELGPFLGELGELLRETYERGGRVTLEVRSERVVGAADQAIPIALLVTEAVSNAFKHGFPEGREGAVRIEVERLDGSVRLAVTDDGVGLPGDGRDGGGVAGAAGAAGIGTTLIAMLAKQLGGRLTVGREAGTRVEVVFAGPALPAAATPALDTSRA